MGTKPAITFEAPADQRSWLRLFLVGASGTGKTYSAAAIAEPFGKVAVLDTERGSFAKYRRRFPYPVVQLHGDFDPKRYIEVIEAAVAQGFDLLIIDSLSHAWNAEGGIQDIVDAAAARAKGNSFAGWKEGTPAYRRLVEAILQSPIHIIATMRAKTEWVLDDVAGKKVPRKIGMAPVMRAEIEYEADLVGDLDQEHTLSITKSRCEELSDKLVRKPGAEFGKTLLAWLNDGAAPAPVPEAVPQEAAQQGGGTSPASAPASSSGGESAAPPESGPQPVDWQVRLLSEASLPVNPLTRAGSNGVLKALGIRVYNELAHGERMRSAVTALRERFPDALSARYARVEVPIASRSKPGHEHLVVLSRAGAEAKAECPCEGFKFSHACRHVPMAWSSLAFSWLTNETPSPREAWEGIDVDKLAGVAREADKELEPQGKLAGDEPAEELRRCVGCGEPWNGIGSRCEECLDKPAPVGAGSAS